MMKIVTPIFFILFILLSFKDARAQCNTTPCVVPMPSVNAQDACVLPNPSALDCYFGATTSDPPVSFPPSWCSAIHNNHWFAFTADATTATFEISTYGCASGNGIQAAVLSTNDCITFQFVSPCLGNIPSGSTQTLTASGLTPGQVYYLCIDGSGGALCDYSINGANPTITGPTTGICIPSSPNSNFTTTSISTWSINPPNAGVIIGNPISTTVAVNWQEPGPAQVCAQSLNCPNAPVECVDVFVGEDIQAVESVDLCQGKTATCAGRTFTAPGNFPVILSSFTGCDSVINCQVNLIPTVTTYDTVLICQGGQASCAGQDFFAPGVFPVTLTAYQGCDSIVRCVVKLVPTTFSPVKMVTMCGPAQYQVCDNFYEATGIYSDKCTGYQGCDSIVNTNLAILEPQAVIAPTVPLDCDSHLVLTLNGSQSSINMATGGTTLYLWTGPGIMGFANQPNVQVNQPGQYCLIVTHGRAGIYCADTACITVTQNSGLPVLPQLTGDPNPCSGTTIIYTAASTANPPITSYTWTTPGNHPFTQISPDSIRITWAGSGPLGQLCVTANNACGASPPKCVPVALQQLPVQPQLAGPDSVCADAGTFLFLLDSLYAGTTYTWAVPAGAVLSGSPDSAVIDFKNATSGQVCVTAKNSCNTAAPVCRTVQVLPTPTADLSGIDEICAGASVSLTFSLSGNPPFDVTWTDGNQNLTLSDIPNGHVVNVNPNQTTTYRLISVNDNSSPACASALTDSVTVNVWQPAILNQTIQICQGEAALLGGALQSSSGLYFDTLNTVHGCDSVIASTLIVNTVDTLVISLTSCDPAAVGTTTQSLTQANGCDSIVITSVALLPTDTTLIYDTSCDPADEGVFVQALTNQFGCDSTVISTIAYSLTDTTLLSASTCDKNGVGIFTQGFVSTKGCDSLVITTVTLLPTDTTYVALQDCNPANTGVFAQTLTAQDGCDSVVISTVVLAPLDTTFLTATTCNPGSVGVFAQTLTTALGCDSILVTSVSLLASDTTLIALQDCDPANVGTFVQGLTNQNGCDSTIITTVTLLLSDTTLVTLQDCDPANVGTFMQSLANQNGCDSTVITTVSLLPSDTTFIALQDCNPANLGTFLKTLVNQYGCDSTLITTVSFIPIDTTWLTATTCNPASAGIFAAHLTTANGCDSTLVTTISLLPSNQVAIQSTTCDPAAAGVFTYPLINQYGCDSIVTETVALLPSDTTFVALSTCDQAQTGTALKVLPNQWGCDSTIITTTSLLPPASCGTTVSLSGSVIPCAQNTGNLTLTATLGEPPFTYTVLLGATAVTSGTIGAMGIPQVVGGLAAGNYTVTISSPNGFSATAQAAIVQLFPPVLTVQTVSNYHGFDISCTGAADGSARASATGGKLPYTYSWSTGSSAAQIDNLDIGAYSITVTDGNGCTASGTTTLQEPTPLQIAFRVNDLDCFGTKDGAIFVEPTGGVPPYRYSINNGPSQSSNTFSGLSAGTYTVMASDANDCQTTEIIAVKAPVPLTVNLGDDQLIDLGGSAVLQAIVNYPFDSLASIIWTPMPDSTECPQCLSQLVEPVVTTAYSVSVVATNGCKDEDKIIVIVDRRKYIYVPNIFSPDGSNPNSVLTVFGNPAMIRNIKQFQLYNRWGESVFLVENFDPNDLSVGWDGNYRGQALNPGVFAWFVEVEFIDGVTQIFEGDVTLIR